MHCALSTRLLFPNHCLSFSYHLQHARLTYPPINKTLNAMQNSNSSLREKEIDSEAQAPSLDGLDGASKRSVNRDDADHDGQIPSATSRPDAQEELVCSFLPQS